MNKVDLEEVLKTLTETKVWHEEYDDGGYSDSCMADDHIASIRLLQHALADLARGAEPVKLVAPLENVERCQRVPDHCNKIMWKGHYIRLRVKPSLRPDELPELLDNRTLTRIWGTATEWCYHDVSTEGLQQIWKAIRGSMFEINRTVKPQSQSREAPVASSPSTLDAE